MRNNRFNYIIAGLLIGLVGAMFLLPGGPVAAQQSAPAAVPTGPVLADERTTIDIVERVGPSVVAINVEVRGTRVNPFEEIERLFPNFLPPQFRDQIITRRCGRAAVLASWFERRAHHQLSSSRVLQSGVEFARAPHPRGFAGSTRSSTCAWWALPRFDLALLELANGDSFPAGSHEIADSARPCSQKVVAMVTRSVRSSVSQGIISAIGREFPPSARPDPHDPDRRAINPGTWRLTRLVGRLIGINTMTCRASPPRAAPSIGIGFAVLASCSLRRYQHAHGRPGWRHRYRSTSRIASIGVQVYPPAYPEKVREVLGMPDYGMVVTPWKRAAQPTRRGSSAAA